MANELVDFLRREGTESQNACGQEKAHCAKMNAAAHRIEWLESLFDFSDPEVVMHTAPGDPVTRDAVVVLRSYYERRPDRPKQSGPGGSGAAPTGTAPTPLT